MPRDREDTAAGGPNTTPEMPAAVPSPVEDDEATRIDPKPPVKAVKPASDDEDDDEATRATGKPKLARETAKILEESRKMNAAGGPKPPPRKMHPLVPIGVAFALLAVLLLVINWMTKPAPTEDGGQPESGGVRKLFDW